MNDEQRATTLLTLAAKLPEHLQPPVGQLLSRARRARRNRIAALSGLTAVVVAAAAIGVPVLAATLGQRGPVRSPSGPDIPAGDGVDAAALARYNWVMLPRSPLGAVNIPLIAWTGTEMLEIGGHDRGQDGAAFNPSDGHWHRIATSPVGGPGAVTAWTGHLLFVAHTSYRGAAGPDNYLVGLYDPAANRWSTTRLPAGFLASSPQGCAICSRPPLLPTGAGGAAGPVLAAVWTGRVVIVATVQAPILRAASYDPVTRRWQMISPVLRRQHPAEGLAMLATRSRVILWSLWARTATRHSLIWGVDVLVLGRRGTWTDVTGSWPQSRTVPQPVFTGSSILVPPSEFWCGACPAPSVVTPAYQVSPDTLQGRYLSRGPLDRDLPELFWTGRAAIAVADGGFGRNGGSSAAAAWDPRRGRWRWLPGRPLISPPVWTGTELLALGPDGHMLAFRR